MLVSTCSWQSEDPTPKPKAVVGQAVTQLDPRIWSLHQDQGGHYWFGSNGAGVFRYDGSELRQFTVDHGLAGLQVRDIQEDPRGHVLVSTNSGVSRFDGKAFQTLEVVEAPDAWRLDPSDVWILFDPGNRGPCRYDGEKIYHLKLPKSPQTDAYLEKQPGTSLSPEGLFSVYRDPSGHVWFGTFAAGLCRYDGESFGWMFEDPLTTTPSGGAFGIRSIFQDRDGDIWICNTRQRFQVQPKSALQNGYPMLQYATKPGLPQAQQDDSPNFTYYPSMAQDASGSLWMATGSDGVWQFDGERVIQHSIGEKAYVISLLVDETNHVWVGTLEQGVFRWDQTDWKPFLGQ